MGISRKKPGKRQSTAGQDGKTPRGPRRWLEGDALFLYEESSAADKGRGSTEWREAFSSYARRKVVVLQPAAAPSAAVVGVTAPSIPGAANWLPLGPTVVMDGQTGGGERQPVAGRVAGMAVGMGGMVVYAASANGGVFRSQDGALTWTAMDQIDLDPNSAASASLICGAVAMDPANPKRVFVGTGEGATYSYFSRRVTGALPAYRGIGVLRTDDGGATWNVEPSDLAGQAFFALALNPNDRESAVAATTAGLYTRKAQPGGQFEWKCAMRGVFSSVVAAADAGGVRFFAARWQQAADAGPEVLWSPNGDEWQSAGTGFPVANVGRIALGVQLGNPGVLYALVASVQGTLHGLYRLDGVGSAWKPASGLPDLLPVLAGPQGNYDLAIAVDPQKADIVYLGGSCHASGTGASIWRCEIRGSGAGYKVVRSASIGEHAHSDVHVLVHSPGNPHELWCGCDGGVFLNRDPRGTGKFTAQNNGLACLCCNFIAQHPTDPSLLFTGLQDNGTAFKTGSFWRHVQDGDGGYCVVNWADPDKVLVFANGKILRSTSGGKTHTSWGQKNNLGWKTMTQPIVGMPMNPDGSGSAADANRVATGVGSNVWISDDFGATWATPVPIALGNADGDVFALAFATRKRLYVGTTKGRVFRADQHSSGWKVTPLQGNAGRLGVTGVITDIAVDWADAARDSIYVAFGALAGAVPGAASSARVWWFDGKNWHARSGTPPNGLLDVEHNALAVDRKAPNNIYVGADIGVWHSADGGVNWELFQNGLPDAPVFDLQIHSTQRLLRAATHGRGVYEVAI